MQYSRKNLILVGLSILALVVLMNILSLLTTATVSVHTDDPEGYVKVVQVAQPGQKGKLFSKQKLADLSVRVKPGSYQVIAYGPGGNFATSTSKIVHVNARERISLTLNPAVAQTPEPVYGSTAKDLRASDSSLQFLDTQNPQSGSLLEVVSGGDVTHLFPDHTDLTSIKWINDQKAVTQDSTGNLYLINGGSINLLRLPFAKNSGISQPTYDVSVNGTIYVSDGQSAYISADGISFRKLFTSSDKITGLTAGSGEVAIITKGEPDKLTVVTDAGHKRSREIDVEQASWSPDFKHILIRQDTADVVLNSSLGNDDSFLINGSDNLVWKDNGTVFYSVDSQLWQLNLATKYSVKLGSLSSGQSITRIYRDTAGSYVYFQTNNGEKQQLYRLSLKNKPINSAVSQLDVYLPLSLDECYANYLNFGQARILLTPFSDSQIDSCITTIKTRLTRYGLNVDRYSFDVLPVATVVD